MFWQYGLCLQSELIRFSIQKIEKCGYGEWINYTPDIADIITVDVSISPVSCKMYDRAGILKDYTKEQLGIFSEGKDDADYLVFTVDIKITDRRL